MASPGDPTVTPSRRTKERLLSGPNGVFASRFNISHTTFADSAYWRGANPPENLRVYRGTRISAAVFPSSKGLFVDHQTSLQAELASRRGALGPWVVSRVDGGAMIDPYDPAYQQPFVRPYGAYPIPGLMTTVDGLAGRDF